MGVKPRKKTNGDIKVFRNKQFDVIEDEKYNILFDPSLCYAMMGFKGVCYKPKDLGTIMTTSINLLEYYVDKISEDKRGNDFFNEVFVQPIQVSSWNIYHLGKVCDYDFNNDLVSFQHLLLYTTESMLVRTLCQARLQMLSSKLLKHREKGIDLKVCYDFIMQTKNVYPPKMRNIMLGLTKVLLMTNNGTLKTSIVDYFSGATGFSIEESLEIFGCFKPDRVIGDEDFSKVASTGLDIVASFYIKFYEVCFYATGKSKELNKLKIDFSEKSTSCADATSLANRLERKLAKTLTELEKCKESLFKIEEPYKVKIENLVKDLNSLKREDNFAEVKITELTAYNKHLKEKIKDLKSQHRVISDDSVLLNKIEKLEEENDRLRDILTTSTSNQGYEISLEAVNFCRGLTVTILGGIKRTDFYERIFNKVFVFDGSTNRIQVPPSTDVVLKMASHVSHSLDYRAQKMAGDIPIISLNGYNENYIISEVFKVYGSKSKVV
jgi:hypothetical protein